MPDGAATSCRATVSVSARESPLLPWRAVVFVSCQDAIRVGHQLMRFLSLGGWLFVSVIGLKGLQGNPKRVMASDCPREQTPRLTAYGR